MTPEARALRIGSLCTGHGGLDMAAQAVFGGTLAWVSDVEPGPCKLLEARHPDVPNLGDLTAVDWSKVEPVDVLTAGYPCQPFSHAGQRKGTDDERHLWPHISNAIGVLRPGVVVLENVAGHLSLGGTTVVAGLAGLRYDARWLVVRAADVGACHRRARWFCVAHDTTRDARWVLNRERLRVVADANSASSEAPGGRQRAGNARRLQPVVGRGPDAPDSDREVGGTTGSAGEAVREPRAEQRSRRRDCVVEFGEFTAAVRRHEAALGRPAPAPTDGKALSPLFVEWMMMLPEGWVTDIITSRTQALKLLGNGVVPPQAEHALRLLCAAEVAA